MNDKKDNSSRENTLALFFAGLISGLFNNVGLCENGSITSTAEGDIDLCQDAPAEDYYDEEISEF